MLALLLLILHFNKEARERVKLVELNLLNDISLHL